MELNPLDHTLVRLIRGAAPLSLSTDPVSVPSGTWDALAERAERTGLAALLFVALKGPNPVAGPPAEISDRLRRHYLQRTLANTLICAEAARLLECFGRAGIPLILLKGVALVHFLYDDAGTRTIGDIDILIHPVDQARAKDLLAAEGYDDAPDLAAGFREEYESERTFVRRGEHPFAVDVHWHLFNVPYFRERVSLDWFWEHTAAVHVAGQPGRMFAPPAQLLHLSAHYALHHRKEGVRWLYDIALLVRQCGHELQWGPTLQTARRFGLIAALHYTLTQVEEVWGLPLTTDGQDALRSTGVTRGEQVAFAAMTSPQNRARIVWDIWSLPGWRGKLTYLGRSLVPEKAYMLRRYKIDDPRLLPWFYLRRLLDGTGYFVRSLGSMAKSVWRSRARTPK